MDKTLFLFLLYIFVVILCAHNTHSQLRGREKTLPENIWAYMRMYLPEIWEFIPRAQILTAAAPWTCLYMVCEIICSLKGFLVLCSTFISYFCVLHLHSPISGWRHCQSEIAGLDLHACFLEEGSFMLLLSFVSFLKSFPFFLSSLTILSFCLGFWLDSFFCRVIHQVICLTGFRTKSASK